MKTPWYQTAIFYQIYPRAFQDSNGDGHGDLPGITQRLDYLQWLGVDCIWLMPIYPSPLKDDGYDISDFTSILSTYGNVADFKALVDAAHARGMRVIADLVLNHTSDQHAWFQQARADRNSPFREYYVWSDTDQKYKDARIIFLDTEPSNWTWDEQAGQYFWHRFYASQPDLNYDSPAVRQAMHDVLAYWMELGIDGFRADAIPYLIEREGTNCENLPETHAYIQSARALMNARYPDAILLGEANQWPEDVVPYFGDGTNELHMNFHFPLMPRIFMALRREQAEPIRWILDKTPALPEGCQWCTFLRNHDELTLEMVTPEERQWMWQEYAPEPRMRQNLGIRRRLAPLLDGERARIQLAYHLLYTLPGTPIIYYGDEIGMGDDVWMHDRNGVRTPMQWDATPNAGFSSAEAGALYSPVIARDGFAPADVNVAAQKDDPTSLLHFVRGLVSLRKAHPVLATGTLEWLPNLPESVLGFVRAQDEAKLWILHNLSGAPVEVNLAGLPAALTDLPSGRSFSAPGGQWKITLAPRESLWLEKEQ